MSLTPDQYAELLDALVNSLAPDEFEIMFRIRLGKGLKEWVNVNTSYRSVVLQAIEVAEDGIWTAKLIEKAMEHFRLLNFGQESPRLEAFLQKYQNYRPEPPTSATIDYYKTCYVRARRLFIDRQDLREVVKTLREDDDAPRTFLVKGSIKTGKTYSRQFISYLEDKPVAGRNEIYRTIYIDLRTSPHSPLRIAETIGLRLEPPADITTIPPQGAEQEAAYAGRLLDWIHGQMNETAPRTVWWIVIDHFTEDNLLKGTKELIKLMIERVEDELRGRCRLVILDYHDNIPLNIEKRSISVQVKPVERGELIEYLKQVFELNDLHKTSEEIEIIGDVILEQVNLQVINVPNGEEQRWEFLYDAVSNAIDRYIKDSE